MQQFGQCSNQHDLAAANRASKPPGTSGHHRSAMRPSPAPNIPKAKPGLDLEVPVSSRHGGFLLQQFLSQALTTLLHSCTDSREAVALTLQQWQRLWDFCWLEAHHRSSLCRLPLFVSVCKPDAKPAMICSTSS